MNTNGQLLSDCEDIESFYLTTTGMRPNLIQLSAGPINLRQQTVCLDGVTLVWVNSEGRQWWRDEMAGEGLMFGFMIDCAGTSSARGRELEPDIAQVWIAGHEMDYLLNGPLCTLEIGVEANVVEELGWDVSGEPVRSLPEGRLDQLSAICWNASLTLTTSFRSVSRNTEQATRSYWRESVLAALESALEPWLIDTGSIPAVEITRSNHRDIVRSAASFFEKCLADDGFEADRLAHALGVSRRTLFRAFRTTLGIGPRRYFELQRLHALRGRLKRCSSADTTVTACANAEGFTELGRLSGIYRHHFGESPSETLRKQFNLL